MPQSYDILGCLKDKACKEFIINNIDEDVQKLALKYDRKLDLDLKSALEYIRIHQKARKKLPGLCEIFGAMDDRSYQQCSSEKVASYRAKLLSGDRVLDLTGGLGIDAIALARTSGEVVCVERNDYLNEMADYNSEALNINNIERINASAEVVELQGFDWVYADPDRRPGDQRRVVGLEDMQPNVLELRDRMPRGQKWAVKLSPLFDLDQLVNVLPEIGEIHVISEDDEVKEVLAICSPKMGDKRAVAVNLGKHPYVVEGALSDRGPARSTNDLPGYIYIPMNALLKSGLSGTYASKASMFSMDSFSIYGSENRELAVGFKGMEVVHHMPPSVRKWKKYLKQQEVKALRIHAKGHAKKGAYWANELNVKEGGEDYLILLFGKQPMGYYCRSLG